MDSITIMYINPHDGELGTRTLEAPEVGWTPDYEGYTRIWANDERTYKTFVVPKANVLNIDVSQGPQKE